MRMTGDSARRTGLRSQSSKPVVSDTLMDESVVLVYAAAARSIFMGMTGHRGAPTPPAHRLAAGRTTGSVDPYPGRWYAWRHQ